MGNFYTKDGLFWLNDQPCFINAGEFHYFRTPADQWEHRLSLLRGAGFNTVAAYIPWLWHQPQSDIFDLDGHTHPMRDLVGFLDLATRMDFYIIARPGPYIMAETINEGIPPWLFSSNPNIAFINQRGETQNIASYLHPDFLNGVERWYEAVFQVLSPRQITQGGKIILIQLDNEMGMLQWVRNIVDLNPDTAGRFAAYLRETYSERLTEYYPTADLPNFLSQQIRMPQLPYGERLIEDYRRFYRGYLQDYAAHLWARAKAHGMEVPPVINIHGFGNGGKTFPIGLSQLVDVMALEGMISATDVYPIFIGEGNFHQILLVNAMVAALQNPEQALFSIEFQAGGNQDFSGAQSSLYDLHSRLSIAGGMRAINHYLFFDGENDPGISPARRHNWGHPVRKDGTTRRHYRRYAELSNVIAAYGADLIKSAPTRTTTIGFLLDDFMTEVNNEWTRPTTDVLTHQRNGILFDFIARGLALTHRAFDAVELSRAEIDPSITPTLWVMMEKQCDAAVQQKLVKYVEKGGRLILVGRMCEKTIDHAPCTILQDALQITGMSQMTQFEPVEIQIFDDEQVPVTFLEAYTGNFDGRFAITATGQTVGFTQRLGAGEVMVLGAALSANTLDDLNILDRMASRMGCAPQFVLSEWADVRLSRGARGRFLFINNYQDDPFETVISNGEGALFGGHPIALPARRGTILPLEWQLRSGIHIHYVTSEITEVIQDGSKVILKTAQLEFFAEVSLSGYFCDSALIVRQIDDRRVECHGTAGQLVFTAANLSG
ncbi:MAG: beta-galactosidase [Anaerolineae bacterium]|nr:beta-galactosidase [Anaerolineae bacterium]